MRLKASAPGSLMLLGEYAVLYGKPALVCAIEQRIAVTLTPRRDQRIEIYSALHGHHVTDLTQLEIKKPFHFVLAVLKQFQGKLKYGCDLEITSDFSDQMGFGSSAAVTVATLAVLVTWLNIRMSPHNLTRQGRNAVLQVQGMGSGADIAASVYGGIVSYQAQPMIAEKLAATHPLTAWYAGYKTPTVEAIKQVQAYFATHPQLFKQLTNSIGQCAADGTQCVRKGEWTRLGEIMNMQQGLMESLGVNTPQLREMVDTLRAQTSVLGAKISGSGLGDCVIGLGAANVGTPLTMSLQGVHCEKI
jgi:mevalonate kinase